MSGRNEAKVRFTAETRGFNEEIRVINSEMAELRSEAKLNQAQMQGAGDSIDYLQAQYQILQRQLELSQNKTQAINEKLQVAIQIYGENSTEVNRLRISLNEAMTQEERFRQAVVTCGNAINEQQAAAQDTRNTLERLTDTVSQQENELEELRRAYQNAVLEQGQESQEARTLAENINDLSGELQENRSQLQCAESAVDSLGNAMEEARDNAEEAGDGYTILKDIVANLATEAIQNCIDAFGELAVEGEAALDKLQAATGVSSETMGQYKDTMYEIYNGAYGESLEDVGESMTTIIQMMGQMDGAELESVTTKALTLRDVYDMDVQESVRAANQMMKQFGITSDEAYNLIAQGSQKGLNANGDLLDIINEYSVHYSQLGLSAEDMFNTLTGAAAEGVFSLDKVGDAIKEFGIRVKDGSDTTNQAFRMLGYGADASEQEIAEINDTISTLEKNLQYAQMEQAGFNEKTSELTKLKNADKIKQYSDELENARQKLSSLTTESGDTRGSLDDLQAAFARGGEDAQDAYWEVWKALSEIDDEVERNTIGVNLFGTMWEDLGDKAITSAMGMNDEFNSTINTMGEIDDIAYGNVGSQLTSLGRTLKNDLMTPIVETLTPVVKDGISWVMRNLPLVEPILIGIIVALGGFTIIATINKLVSASTKIFKGLNLVMSANPIGIVIVAIAALAAAFITAYKKCESFRNIVDTAFAFIKNVAGVAVNAIIGFFTNAWQNIKNVWQAVEPFFSAIWNGIKNVVAVVITEIVSMFQAAWGAIQAVWNFVQPYFNTIWTGISSIFSVVISVLSGYFRVAWEVIQGIWSIAVSYFSMIWENIKVVFSVVAEVLGGCFRSAWEIIKAVWDIAVSYFSMIWENIKLIFSVVKDVLSGNFSEAWESIKQIFGNFVSFFLNLWESVKQIFSGVVSFYTTIFQGAVDGIKGIFGNIIGFFHDIVDKIQDIFKNIGTVIGDAIKNTVATAINGVLSTAVSIINGFISAINFAIDAINAIPGVKIEKLDKLEVPKLAAGGIATRETLAIVGEGKEDEAIAPISKLQGYVSDAVEAANNRMNTCEMMSELRQIRASIDNGKNIYLDGYKVSKRTGIYDDRNSGKRIQLSGRGVMV